MNSLILDFSEDNAIFRLFFGNDSSTHRRVAFVSSIYDAMFMSALVSVSFRFTMSSSSSSSQTGGRGKFFFPRAQDFFVGRAPYAKAFAFSWGTLWTGHYLVDSSMHTFEKRFKKMQSRVQSFFMETTPNAVRDREEKAEEEEETMTSVEMINILEKEEQKEGKSSNKQSTSLKNKLNTSTNNRLQQEAEDVVNTKMNRIPSSFNRSTSSETIRAFLLSPFDAVAVGIFSSHYLGRPKCADGVVDLIFRQKRFDVLIPTVMISMMVRLMPELVKKRNYKDDKERKGEETNYHTEFLTRFFLLPIVAAGAMRSVSHRWSMNPMTNSSSSSSTSSSKGSSSPNEQISSRRRAVMTKVLSGAKKVTVGAVSLSTALVRSVFALRHLPSAIRQAVAFSMTFPSVLFVTASYLAVCQFTAMIVATTCIGVESNRLRKEIEEDEESQNTSKARSRHGKFVTHCAAVNLPSHLTEVAFSCMTHPIGMTMMINSFCDTLVASFDGTGCSEKGRRRIIDQLQEVAKSEKKEIKKALRSFELLTALKEGESAKNNKSDNDDDNDDSSSFDTLKKRRAVLEATAKSVEEIEKILLSSNNFFSIVNKSDNSNKRVPDWLRLEYQLQKVVPSILDNNVLSSKEQMELITEATLKLLKK